MVRRAWVVISLISSSKGGPEGGILFPFASKNFDWIPSSHCINPIVAEPALLKSLSHSHFLLFFVDESHSQCMKSHFPSQKMRKSQLPFYLFRTLSKIWLFIRSGRDKDEKKTCKLKIVSHNTIQRFFQFFFEKLIRLDLVWKIVKYTASLF